MNISGSSSVRSASRCAAIALSLGAALFANSAVAQGKSLMAAGATSAPSGTPTSTTAKPAALPPVRSFSTDVRNGILTVDGMVGKAQLNYNVHSAYMYFTVPGVGTAIVAQSRFMNALPQKNAFHGNTLTINVNGHVVELTSAGQIAGEKNGEAWVSIDPLFGAGKVYPEMGFGDTIQRPYVWPGSKTEKPAASAYVTAPPLPSGLRPKPEISSTYSVTVPAQQPDATPAKPKQ